jgi:hypothetical protein
VPEKVQLPPGQEAAPATTQLLFALSHRQICTPSPAWYPLMVTLACQEPSSNRQALAPTRARGTHVGVGTGVCVKVAVGGAGVLVGTTTEGDGVYPGGIGVPAQVPGVDKVPGMVAPPVNRLGTFLIKPKK